MLTHRHRSALLGLVVAVAAGGCTHAGAAPAPVVLELRQASEAWNRASGSGDPAAIVSYFAPDVVVMSPQARGPARGVEANRAAWERFFRGTNATHTMTTDTVVVATGGDMGYVLGTWSAGVDMPQGRAAGSGEYLAVWRRLQGVWKIVALSAR